MSGRREERSPGRGVMCDGVWSMVCDVICFLSSHENFRKIHSARLHFGNWIYM